ncbi:hypothetical protein [Paenarthrobacter nitroguajacolicus]|uniref:hypothetical protein n=1 Tax=Paenarthrobacter nitroguajacolicus TaxID=211146 RepID=UPI00285F7129|nr:hypothetical protein [Paenarthrobacter nitroguajacolicus]MDR6637043.1 hypothetical protein [Paenarthrobacter nitroguajacolicus]
MKSREAVAARRLAHHDWLGEPAVLSSPELAEVIASHEAPLREGAASNIPYDIDHAS